MIFAPFTIVPLSHTFGRTRAVSHNPVWITYCLAQFAFLGFIAREFILGRIVERGAGILDQPAVIDKSFRFAFINALVANILAPLCFDKTLQGAYTPHKEKLKYVFIAFLEVAAYLSYLSVQIILPSFLSQSLIKSGTWVIICPIGLLFYSFLDSRAARELGVSRVNLYSLIDKYDINMDQFKAIRTTGKTQIKKREVS